jgi:hypothetical protein
MLEEETFNWQPVVLFSGEILYDNVASVFDFQAISSSSETN